MSYTMITINQGVDVKREKMYGLCYFVILFCYFLDLYYYNTCISVINTKPNLYSSSFQIQFRPTLSTNVLPPKNFSLTDTINTQGDQFQITFGQFFAQSLLKRSPLQNFALQRDWPFGEIGPLERLALWRDWPFGEIGSLLNFVFQRELCLLEKALPIEEYWPLKNFSF